MDTPDISHAPRFSIIICTRDREQMLSEVVESIFSLETEALLYSYELVIVDNGSSDNTKGRVHEFAARAAFPIRYVHEPRQGLSYARNAGVESSGGDYLAFIDDDCTVRPDWLANLMRAFSRYDCDIVQGKILLNVKDANLPDWIDEEDLVNLGLFDLGDRVKSFDNVVGGNMCFRRTVFRKYGMFDSRYGAGTSGVGEDTEFSRRLKNGNVNLLYIPDVIVFHLVRPEKLSKEFFLDRQYKIGYSFALFRDNPGGRLSRILELRRKRLIRSMRSILYGFAGQEAKQHKQRKRMALYAGKIEALRQKKHT